MKNIYYLAGKKVTENEFSDLLSGKTVRTIRCPDNSPGVPVTTVTDYLAVSNGEIVKDDPMTTEILEHLNLAIEDTLIIFHYYDEDADPLQSSRKVSVYGCW